MIPEDFVRQFRAAKASAILRTPDESVAREAMSAAVRGGFRIVEFTMSIPNVATLISEFAGNDELIVGAGTVLSKDQVREVVAAGASFVVSPVVDADVIAECRECGVACMPGCSTPTEMFNAYQAGAQLQKLFPQTGTGPLWVKHCLGPLPFLKIVPTSGVTLDNVKEYFQAGAHAVGFVASLFSSEDMAAGNFESIEDRARRINHVLRALEI